LCFGFSTKAGKQYYPVLRDAFDKIADGTEAILKPHQPDVLTIQLYSTFAIRWLIPKLPSFQKKHPNISVRLNTSQMDVDFKHSDVDACVMIGNPTQKSLHYTPLFPCEIFPVCSPSLLKNNQELKKPEQLANFSILQVYPSKQDWYIWLETIRVTNVDPEGGLQLDSYDHALTIAMQGMGVALGMQVFVGEALASGMLIEPFPKLRVKLDSQWYFVCRQEKAKEKKIALFEAWLLNEIQKNAEYT
jgi:LysR family glycine cleavage system transcriptional activator